jgi:two-component system, NarL family, nitrate/nitrite response regulator NarL
VSSSTLSLPILLASDFPIFRESLKSHFEATSAIELVACANSKDEVVPQMEAHRPKLVLLDLNLDCNELCTLLDDIHKNKEVFSLIMSDDVESSHVIELLRHGANGVVPRRTSPELLTKSITTVSGGHFWVSRAMITDFVTLIRQGPVSAALKTSDANRSHTSEVGGTPFSLTRRETQIVRALVDGQTNKDIANTFGISEYTVKHHLTSVYDKLGVYNRVELVLFAMNHGICSPTAIPVPNAS